MLIFIFHAVLIAVLSWCYHTILKDFLLSKWFSFGWQHFGKYEGTWKEYIYKPVWGCQYCTSGQLALWLYIFIYWCNYDLYYHIMFIAFTIFITKVIFSWIESPQ
ncbi:hypothetical protein C7S20_19480 [Christiangramia fulva]|uniref:DUF1360 domain-containing protein n=1 Tax=Christiangramia fulva TaxID=2126553 RepID=A0A2R3ZAE5_9FLAO|nr:hypothetical protein [Christiangramia fulva]AVR47258.1 hypothetical protein C7S20_19480 [Christiangramia fulva]